MSDLISRKALLRRLDNLSVKNITDDNMAEIVEELFHIIKTEINNAPALSKDVK